VHAVTRAFIPDRRGNRLERHEFLAVPGGRSHRIHLRGSAEIAEQFRQDRSGWWRSYQQVLELAEGGEWWTHSLEASGPGPGLSCSLLLDVLSEVLTLPRLPGADFALALDWCKAADGDIWRDTFAGKLVAAGRYRSTHPAAVRAAAVGLAARMAEVVRRHPLLDSADVIVPAPGHDRSVLSFGEWVGREVARTVGTASVDVATRHVFRPPAKDLRGPDRRVAEGEFFFREDLSGCAVLVVDDVYQTGQTVTATAAAARRAGAASVYVLTGTRTRGRLSGVFRARVAGHPGRDQRLQVPADPVQTRAAEPQAVARHLAQPPGEFAERHAGHRRLAGRDARDRGRRREQPVSPLADGEVVLAVRLDHVTRPGRGPEQFCFHHPGELTRRAGPATPRRRRPRE
jgi:predicted amidophosphoribosyltransferase